MTITLQDGTIKQRYVHVGLGMNPKTCFKCGMPIGFFQLKSGKWMPVTADWNGKSGEWEIITNRGAYGNLTPVHRHRMKCNKCGRLDYFHKDGDICQGDCGGIFETYNILKKEV